MKKLFYIGSVLIAIGCLAGLYFIYRNTFDGDVSNSISDWGSFGSYFGGVAGPIIGMFSLFAIMITVGLQFTMLDRQMAEFKKLHILQNETLKQTQVQVEIQKLALEQAEIQLDLQHEQFESEAMSREQDRCLASIQAMQKQGVSSLDVQIELFNLETKILDIKEFGGELDHMTTELEKVKLQKVLLDSRATHNANLQQLQILTIEILSPTFDTVDKLQTHFGRRAKDIINMRRE